MSIVPGNHVVFIFGISTHLTVAVTSHRTAPNCAFEGTCHWIGSPGP